MTLRRTMVGINKAEDAGPTHGQIRSAKAFRWISPTALASVAFRGWIRQEALCDGV